MFVARSPSYARRRSVSKKWRRLFELLEVEPPRLVTDRELVVETNAQFATRRTRGGDRRTPLPGQLRPERVLAVGAGSGVFEQHVEVRLDVAVAR